MNLFFDLRESNILLIARISRPWRKGDGVHMQNGHDYSGNMTHGASGNSSHTPSSNATRGHSGNMPPHGMPRHTPPFFVNVFVGAEAAAAICFAVVLLTVLCSPKVVNRTSVWVNFCITCEQLRRIWPGERHSFATSGLIFTLSFLLPFFHDNADLCSAGAVMRFGAMPL
jgi:hypothetical protein